MSTELELRPEEQALRGFEIAERTFTPERRQAIAKFLNVEAEDPVLLPYLVTCASYGLSPIMGEIWLIPQKVTVRDGDSEKKENRYRPAVGRDGFLSIARRDRRYGGLKGAVVCEHDTFEVEYDGSEDEPKVLHRFASKPTVFEAVGDAERYRGRIVGAWAKAYVKGQPPVFYFADIREHGKKEQAFEWGQARGERLWWYLDENGLRTHEVTGRPLMVPSGAWGYASAMILKAAQSYVLRIGFGITGLAPADEIAMDATAASEEGPGSVEITSYDWSEFPAPDELVERLGNAVDAVNAQVPMSWSPAKIDMVLRGRTVEELQRRVAEIENEADLLADRAREREVIDAEVVEPLDETELAELESKRHQQADLQAALESAELGSEEHATLASDLDQVSARVSELAARENVVDEQ